MKLTNTLRDAFVRAVMADTPAVDYVEQIRKMARDDIFRGMPRKLKTALDDPELKDMVKASATLHLGERPGVPSISVGALPGDWNYKWTLSDKAKVAINDLADKRAAQIKTRDSLESRLRAVAYACSTRKALAEALPEFAKYLPPEEAVLRSLPVVTGVVTDFVKAGWPKDQKKAA